MKKEKQFPLALRILILLLVVLILGIGMLAKDESIAILCKYLLYGLIGVVVVYVVMQLNKQMSRENSITKEKESLAKERLINQYKELLSDMQAKYGSVTQTIHLESASSDPNKSILVFENKSVLIIRGEAYRFSEILGCELTDDGDIVYQSYSSKTKTSTGSMIGRAVVGGVLLGGVGAVIGGATANKKQTHEQQKSYVDHNYTVHITVDRISDSCVSINFRGSEENARAACSLLNVIIDRNSRT